MSKKRNGRRTQTREASRSQVAWLVSSEAYDTLCVPGYTRLDRNPEVVTACRRIAELIGSITIHLMANRPEGDTRIVNELSRAIDIEPDPYMTRSTWMQAIVMNLLLYGHGNSIVIPHTRKGFLRSLEPVAASRVQLQPVTGSYRDYRVLIDGIPKKPQDLLHFVYNPDETYLWKGMGVRLYLKDVVKNLAQAQTTENAFMASKWKPSIIVKVDALTDEFASKEGRKKLLESYVEPSENGEPWLIPAENFEVEQIRPLTLADLAINDTVQLDKRTVASVLGVPPFLLGVGDFNRQAWNNFVQNTLRPLCVLLQQELTKKLILSPNMYLKFNVRSLLDWDLQSIYTVFGGLYSRGVVTGNEVRDMLGMSPREGLSELTVLENYIPLDMIGAQNKLQGEGENG